MPNAIAFALMALTLSGLGGKKLFRRDVRSHVDPPASNQATEPTPDIACARFDADLERHCDR